jgi:predicted amidohydrolase YtcJ
MRRRGFLSIALVIAALALAAGTGLHASSNVTLAVGPTAPDLVLYNGKISTLDAKNTQVEAIAVKGGTIVAIGPTSNIRALAGKGTRQIDLKGRRVLPGIVDGTLHGVRNGYHCIDNQARLDTAVTRKDALAVVSNRAASLPAGEWIITQSGGWTVNQLDTKGMFTLAELDTAVPNNPVDIQAGGFTGAMVNTKALQMLGLNAGDPGVVLDASGKPTGQLLAPATTLASSTVGQFFEKFPIEHQENCLADFIRTMNAAGITSWDDPGGNDLYDPVRGGPLREALRDADGHGYQAITQLYRDGRLNARITLNMTSFTGVPNVMRDIAHTLSFVGDDMLRYYGIGEEIYGPPYLDNPPPAAEYIALAKTMAARRVHFENHASTAATFDARLDAFEAANQVYPIAKLHWIILHPGRDGVTPNAQQLARVKALGIGVVPTDDSAVNGRPTTPPYQNILRSGVKMCLGTDALDAGKFSPFVNLWYTQSGKTYDPAAPGVPADQRLTRMQAIRAATAQCGWFVDKEGKVGTLEVGRYGDLIVLNKDYFTVPLDDVKSISSDLTVVGGKVTYAGGAFKGLDGQR